MKLLLVCLILIGCSEYDPIRDLGNYSCNKEQLTMVKIELEICQNTGYFSSDCLKMARRAQCQYTYKESK